MKSYLLTAVLLCVSGISYAQTTPLSIRWSKTFGGAADDEAVDIVDLSNGEFVVVGNSGSNNGEISGHHGALGVDDVTLTKLNADHTVAWQHSFGGSLEDVAQEAVASSDGEIVVVGYTGSNDGDFSTNAGTTDASIAKFDASGNQVWVHTFGGQLYDEFYGIHATADNGFIVCGTTNSSNVDVQSLSHFGDYDAWVVKFSSSGAVEWQKTFGGSDEDVAYDITQTNDQGYIFTGYTYLINGAFSLNHGSSDMMISR